MYRTDVMILTGAGASMPLGIPGMIGMAKGFKKTLGKRTDTSRTYDLLLKLGASEDVEEILQLVNNIIQLPDSSLSAFIERSVAPTKAQAKKLDLFCDRRDADIVSIERFRDELLDWISTQCLKFDRSHANRVWAEITELAAAKGIPLYTTNYDAVLEHVAEFNNIAIVDNFVRNELGRFFWDETHHSFSGHGLRIVKMHGSVQWHAMPDGKIERIQTPARLSQEGHDLTRLMIFPTRFKEIYQQNYFPLYSSFVRTLSATRVLFVIGHSLRDEYLFAAIRERLREPDFLLAVFDPALPSDLKKLQASDSRLSGNIVHIKAGLETAYPLIVQTLKDKPVDEIGGHLSDAAQALMRRQTEKVELSAPPRYVMPGEKVGSVLRIKTVTGGLEPRLSILIDGKATNRKIIPIDAMGSDSLIGTSGIVINGMIDTELEIAWQVPEALQVGTHDAMIELIDAADKTRAKAIRKVRIKRVPA